MLERGCSGRFGSQEENRRSAEKFREMADKVYGLMDSLRLNQVELKRMEAENAARNKKFANLEKLMDWRRRGFLNDVEFEAAKQRMGLSPGQ